MNMKRKFLEAMGFTNEQIDAVMDEHGKTVTAIRTQRDTHEETADRLQEQVKKLEKAAGSGTQLQETVDRLTLEKENLQKQYDSVQLDSQIKLAVAKEAKDAADILLFVDKTNLKLSEDGKTIEGLDEAVKTLKESKPYLFDTDGAPADPVTPPATPPGATPPPPPNYTPPAGNTNNPKDADLAELGRKDAERYAQKTQ